MSTLYTTFLLLVFGIAMGWIVMVLLPFVGLLGVWVGGEPGKRAKSQLAFGVAVASLFQTFFYLGYVAFIIGWTGTRVANEGLSKYFIWMLAFLGAVLPIWFGASAMKVIHKRKATGYANVTVEASYVTGFLAFIGFFVFAFASKATFLWTWIPYVGQ